MFFFASMTVELYPIPPTARILCIQYSILSTVPPRPAAEIEGSKLHGMNTGFY